MRNLSFFLILGVLAQAVSAASFEEAAEIYRENRWQEAYRLFTELAEEGDARAQTVLALMLKSGEGVPPDDAAAFSWYRRAADNGYTIAQFHTGIMLAEGVGTEANEEEATRYLQLAADAGYHKAADALSLLRETPITELASTNVKPWSRQWDLKLPADLRLLPLPAETQTPPAMPTGTFRVQLGAMSSSERALRLWEEVNGSAPELFASLSLMIREVEISGQAVHRVQAGPFDTVRDALSFCRDYSLRTGNDCLAVTR